MVYKHASKLENAVKGKYTHQTERFIFAEHGNLSHLTDFLGTKN